MAFLRNKRKLAAINKDNISMKIIPRITTHARNTIFPRSQDFLTQVSEEIEVIVTKKLSQEFSRTESRILGALSRLDEFILNPQAPVHSETVPEVSWNSNIENQGINEDLSQNDPHPEVQVSLSQFL